MFSIDSKIRMNENLLNNGEILQKITVEQKTSSMNIDDKECKDYIEAIKDLNLLQSNTQTIALAKYKRPREILPLFEKQLNLAGISVSDLDKLNVLHVSGTKGKGSTCAFLESILRKAGLRTGFYNSPHLIHVTERIKINGEPISDTKFSAYFREIYDRLLIDTRIHNVSMPSYFSFLTILAFHIFLKEKVDCTVLEVGIGGEYDPTNIIQKPIVCGISTLDFDHTNILGKKIESIAWAKSGIAKNDVPLFILEQEQEVALNVIRSRALERQSPFFICRPSESISECKLGIKGPIQRLNATLAIEMAKYFLLTSKNSKPNSRHNQEVVETSLEEVPKFFQEALEECKWPGRCQIIEYPRIRFFVDGAHTSKSMKNCLEWFLEESTKNNIEIKRILMVNVIGERSKQDVLRPLSYFDGFDEVLFSTNRVYSSHDSSKSETFSKMDCDLTKDKSIENVRINIKTWLSLLKEVGRDKSQVKMMASTSECLGCLNEKLELDPKTEYHVLVTGSLHFVGAILQTLPRSD